MKIFKKILQFSAVIALFFVIIGFILFLATDSIVNDSGDGVITGTAAIFGDKGSIGGIITVEVKPAPVALVGWIFILLSMIALIVVSVLPVLHLVIKKGKAINLATGVAGAVLSFAIGFLLLLAGVFMLLVLPSFDSANSTSFADNYLIGPGWIVGAVLVFLAALVMLLPAAGNILSIFDKKKKQ